MVVFLFCLFYCFLVSLFVCLFVCLLACLLACLFVCSFVRLFVCLFVCFSGNIACPRLHGIGNTEIQKDQSQKKNPTCVIFARARCF